MPLQLNENIRSILGYEGLYCITSFGRVWSYKRKYVKESVGNFLKIQINGKGYSQVRLYKDGKGKLYLTHILTAQTFIPNPQNLPEVNHKDGNKQNNFAGTAAKNYTDGNLEWCTKQGNMNHAAINHRYTHKISSEFYGVSFNPSVHNINKPWRARITYNRKGILIGSYKTEIEAAQAYNDYIIEHKLNRPLNEIG